MVVLPVLLTGADSDRWRSISCAQRRLVNGNVRLRLRRCAVARRRWSLRVGDATRIRQSLWRAGAPVFHPENFQPIISHSAHHWHLLPPIRPASTPPPHRTPTIAALYHRRPPPGGRKATAAARSRALDTRQDVEVKVNRKFWLTRSAPVSKRQHVVDPETN
jgi:hypothetical protein